MRKAGVGDHAEPVPLVDDEEPDWYVPEDGKVKQIVFLITFAALVTEKAAEQEQAESKATPTEQVQKGALRRCNTHACCTARRIKCACSRF